VVGRGPQKKEIVLQPQSSLRLARREYVFLSLALLAVLTALWQWALFVEDNTFLDGICSALGTRDLAPEARAVRLYRWASTYDDYIPPSESAASPGRFDLPTLRSIVEHRAYFQADCGSKTRLLAALAGRAGLQARELRLCDSAHITRHVVCEMRIGSRWAVLDPTIGLDFRRRDGRLATAAELCDPSLFAANAGRAPRFNARIWRFDHAERLHFERLPLLGGLLRRLARHLTGRPAEELALPAVLDRPRLTAAVSFALLALFAMVAAGKSARQRRKPVVPSPWKVSLQRRVLAPEAEQD
jgi:hypothetical protein